MAKNNAVPSSDELAEIPSDVCVFKIQAAARMCGLNPRLLRSWEGEGLLSPSRTRGGHRLYSKNDLHRVETIKMYREAGLAMAGMKSLWSKERKNGKGVAP